MASTTTNDTKMSKLFSLLVLVCVQLAKKVPGQFLHNSAHASIVCALIFKTRNSNKHVFYGAILDVKMVLKNKQYT